MAIERPSAEPRPIAPVPLLPESTGTPDAGDGGPGGRQQSRRDRLMSLAVLIPVAIIGLLPFYWMVTTALTPRAAAIRVPPNLLPFDATLDNLVALFEQAPVLLWAFNSLLVAG
nr:hypothetical protein [Chloroflexota bacterium]